MHSQGLFYLPLLFLLNRALGFAGFIYAQPITDAIMLVLFNLRMIRPAYVGRPYHMLAGFSASLANFSRKRKEGILCLRHTEPMS